MQDVHFVVKNLHREGLGALSFVLECIFLQMLTTRLDACSVLRLTSLRIFQGSASQALHDWLASFLSCLEGRTWHLCT